MQRDYRKNLSVHCILQYDFIHVLICKSIYYKIEKTLTKGEETAQLMME